MNTAFQIFALTLGLASIVGYFWSGVWVYCDAKRRGKPPLLVCLLVLLFCWPVSLLIWIALRPENTARKFNLDDFRVQ